MTNGSLQMQSWQVFHFARKHLGRSSLYAIFGKKNARKVDYWAENPKYTSKLEDAYDPLKGIKTLVDLLDDHGHSDVVRAVISYLAVGTSVGESNFNPRISDLLPTMAEEQLCDYSKVGELHRGIEQGLPAVEVDALKLAAIEEIERTVAMYRKSKMEDS